MYIRHFLRRLHCQISLRIKIRPKALQVRDERTYALLESLAAKLSVPISVEEYLPALDEEQEDMFEYKGQNEESLFEDIMGVIGAILEMDKETFYDMPEELRKNLEMVIEMGMLPEDMVEALADKLGL